MTKTRTDIEALLPLQPAAFHILLALSGGDRHGYAIMQEVEAGSGGKIRLSAGTLYRTVQRLLEDGLITEPRTIEVVDTRRRPYRITPFGKAVARAESARLAGLVQLAARAGLLPEAT